MCIRLDLTFRSVNSLNCKGPRWELIISILDHSSRRERPKTRLLRLSVSLRMLLLIERLQTKIVERDIPPYPGSVYLPGYSYPYFPLLKNLGYNYRYS